MRLKSPFPLLERLRKHHGANASEPKMDGDKKENDVASTTLSPSLSPLTADGVISQSEASYIPADAELLYPKVVTSSDLCEKCHAYLRCEMQKYFQHTIWKSDGYLRKYDSFQTAVQQKCVICLHLWRGMKVDLIEIETPENIRLSADPISWSSNKLHFTIESKRYDTHSKHDIVRVLAGYVLGALPFESKLSALYSYFAVMTVIIAHRLC
jgi:hypothetical protein